MKVLLDTNIILDFFLEREPFYRNASKIFDAIAEGNVLGFVSASSMTDIFYICRRQTQSVEEARDIIATTLMLLDVCPVDRSVLDAAIASRMVDFEDAVQVACAESQGLDVIVTRNQEDFQTLNVGVVSPEILLHRL